MNGHAVALWAGVTAFLTNLAALKIVHSIYHGGTVATILGALVVSLIVAGAVYARNRWEEARELRWKREHPERPERAQD